MSDSLSPHHPKYQALADWLGRLPSSLGILSMHCCHCNDASFREYFRIKTQKGTTLIAMYSPPDRENNEAFIRIAKHFHQHKITVPRLIAQDEKQGFFLMTDFGDNTYFKALGFKEYNSTQLYLLALEGLVAIQSCPQITATPLPAYSEALLIEELKLFRTWFVEKHLGLCLGFHDQAQLTLIEEKLVQSALSQPQVCVHRDYHSRNLMYLSDGQLGVIDFQDAVWGAITYDLVSLLRDCYVKRPEAWVRELVTLFYHKIKPQHSLLSDVDFDTFMRWFDWMGVQRHLKVLGIFARLYWRDGKAGYLDHLPRIYDYLISVSQKYEELSWIKVFLMERCDIKQKAPL